MHVLIITTKQIQRTVPDEDVKTIDEIPVYSINKPKDESLAILKILSNVKGS